MTKDIVFRTALGGIHLGFYSQGILGTEYHGSTEVPRELLYLRARNLIFEDRPGRNYDTGRQSIYYLSRDGRDLAERLTDGRTGLPVIRKGVTAYHPGMDFNGKSLGLLDITSYPGSSGSPVLIYNQGSYPTQNGITIGNRGIFLGILIGYSPGATDIEHADLHLGAYIKAKALNDLKEEMLKSLSF